MIEETYTWIQQQLHGNDVFAGIIGGSLFASGLYALRSVPARLWHLFLLQGTAHVTVYNDDEAFEWLNQWLAKHPYAKRTRRMKLSTFYMGDDDDAPADRIQWSLAPGPGAHLFWHQGRLVWLERQVQEGDGGAGSHRRKESIEVRMLGRSTKPIRALIGEAQELRRGGDRVDIYGYHGCWQRVARKLPRSLETVVLPRTQIDRLVADAEWFFQAVGWYRDRGVPYRRGYLLSGPPGCGKTSLVMALASHFRRPIYTLNLGSIWSDDKLFEAVANVPAAALLLIEDIDAAKASKVRKPKKEPERRSVLAPQGPRIDEPEGEAEGMTLSGLLNAIDGVASSDGRLLIMTTNHPERLDDALIRPGRVDLQEYVGPLGAGDARRLFLRFFPESEDAADALAASMDAPQPGAVLQGTFMKHCNDPWAAVAAVRGDYREAAE